MLIRQVNGPAQVELGRGTLRVRSTALLRPNLQGTEESDQNGYRK